MINGNYYEIFTLLWPAISVCIDNNETLWEGILICSYYLALLNKILSSLNLFDLFAKELFNADRTFSHTVYVVRRVQHVRRIKHDRNDGRNEWATSQSVHRYNVMRHFYCRTKNWLTLRLRLVKIKKEKRNDKAPLGVVRYVYWPATRRWARRARAWARARRPCAGSPAGRARRSRTPGCARPRGTARGAARTPPASLCYPLAPLSATTTDLLRHTLRQSQFSLSSSTAGHRVPLNCTIIQHLAQATFFF